MLGGTLIVIPTKGHFDYAARAVVTGVYHTPNATALVVDDASPDWSDAWERAIAGACPPGRFISMRLTRSAVGPNLTRSWNRGLVFARERRFECVVLANSDVVFGRKWWDGMAECLSGNEFVGPLTNAPGHQPLQHYKDSGESDEPDSQELIDQRSGALAAIARTFNLGPRPIAKPAEYLNGFCFAGRTESFWRNSFDNLNVFDPAKPMVGNEDEFFSRARAKGMRIAVSSLSFVYHYRSVSRGIEHANIGAYRRPSA